MKETASSSPLFSSKVICFIWRFLANCLRFLFRDGRNERKNNGSQISTSDFRVSYFPLRTKRGAAINRIFSFMRCEGFLDTLESEYVYIYIYMYNQSQRLKRVTIANCLEKQSYKSSYVTRRQALFLQQRFETGNWDFSYFLGASSHQEDTA